MKFGIVSQILRAAEMAVSILQFYALIKTVSILFLYLEVSN